MKSKMSTVMSEMWTLFWSVFRLSLNIKFNTQTAVKLVLNMGVARFATLSNGEFFEPLNAFKTYKGKLAKTCKKRLKNKVNRIYV